MKFTVRINPWLSPTGEQLEAPIRQEQVPSIVRYAMSLGGWPPESVLVTNVRIVDVSREPDEPRPWGGIDYLAADVEIREVTL